MNAPMTSSLNNPFHSLLPLVRREWLQHRMAWALLMLVPLVLALLPLQFGQIELDAETSDRGSAQVALMLGLVSIVATTAVLFGIVWLSSLFVAVGTPRRDHADRSIEFWLSLPTGHAVSLAVPLLVHLILVPAAALVAGWLAGLLISLVVVSRVEGFAAWLALPWGALLAGGLSIVARLAAGLVLATLWLSPLLLLAMLINAWFKRWGLPVLGVALGVGGTVMDRVFGWPWLLQALGRLGSEAGVALAGASGQALGIRSDEDPTAVMLDLPAWALRDFAAALENLGSMAFVAALAVAVALFLTLVAWRRAGAGHTG